VTPHADGERNNVAPLGERNGGQRARRVDATLPELGEDAATEGVAGADGVGHRDTVDSDGRRALSSDRGDRRTRGHQHSGNSPVEKFARAVGWITIRPDPGKVVVGAPEQ
jgi:hypothetical protein